MTEREQFEAWMRDTHGPGVNLVRSDDGYISTVPHRAVRMAYASVQMLWEAWNRRAQTAQAVPLLSEDEITAAWDGHVLPMFGKNGINPIVFARRIEQAMRAKLGAGVLQWIACVDAMPPKNTEVLIKFRDTPLPSTGQYTASPFDNDGWCYPKENDPEEVGPVTNWMPLPPPPGIVGKEGT